MLPEVGALRIRSQPPTSAPPALPDALRPVGSGRAVSSGSSSGAVATSTPGTCAADQQTVSAQVVTLVDMDTCSCVSGYGSSSGPQMETCEGSDTAASNEQKFGKITYANDSTWLQLRSIHTGQCVSAVASSDSQSSAYLTLQPCAARTASNKLQAFTSVRSMVWCG